MGALLEVRGIVTRFGDQRVHAGLDMQVEEGEVFGVIGGSGAGKSVLLRTILGLRRPDEGTVRFLGRDLQQLSPPQLHALKTSYGVTFQAGAPFSALTPPQKGPVPVVEHMRLGGGAPG